jgi:hypothetical protein
MRLYIMAITIRGDPLIDGVCVTLVCANQRPYGSVRGALGNWYSYRDRIMP